jgi:hypothetical protein
MTHSLPLALLISTALVAQQPSSAENGEALLEAAHTGNRARVVALLDSGVDVNTASRYRVTALGFAAERGHRDVVRVLVERGADLNVTDWFYGSRPLDFALRGGHLEIALYLLERGSRGAASVLNAGIRNSNVAAVKAALATGQIDATALAGALSLAKQTGDAAVMSLVNDAAARTPATAPVVLTLDPTLLRSYQGAYHNAISGAAVTVSFDGERLVVTADGQRPLRLQPVEERRFIAADAPEVTVTFAGRGGIVERVSIARSNNAVRYEREGFGDATSPAPDPGTATPSAAAPATPAAGAGVAPRGKPLPWPAKTETSSSCRQVASTRSSPVIL